MTVNAMLLSALTPIMSIVRPDVYTGEETRYIVFNYDLVPTNFADNTTPLWKALVQVHLILPIGENSVALRARIATELKTAGFTMPEIIDATDKDSQHFVFETETITTLKGD